MEKKCPGCGHPLDLKAAFDEGDVTTGNLCSVECDECGGELTIEYDGAIGGPAGEGDFSSGPGRFVVTWRREETVWSEREVIIEAKTRKEAKLKARMNGAPSDGWRIFASETTDVSVDDARAAGADE